jgi:hypothetical protein
MASSDSFTRLATRASVKPCRFSRSRRMPMVVASPMNTQLMV